MDAEPELLTWRSHCCALDRSFDCRIRSGTWKAILYTEILVDPWPKTFCFGNRLAQKNNHKEIDLHSSIEAISSWCHIPSMIINLPASESSLWTNCFKKSTRLLLEVMLRLQRLRAWVTKTLTVGAWVFTQSCAKFTHPKITYRDSTKLTSPTVWVWVY